MLRLLLLPMILAGCNASIGQQASREWADDYAAAMRLWYEQPAERWEEALPVGNGRLGAMVFGRAGRERIQINEESVWAGRRLNDNNPGARANLDEIRRLIFEGRNAEAHALATEYLLATPRSVRSYQTLMDLALAHPDGEFTAYERGLDLGTGIARTKFERDGVRFSQEVFASAVDDVLVVRFWSAEPGGVTTAVSLSRSRDASVEAVSERELLLSGQIRYEASDSRGPGGLGMRFAARLRATVEGGSVRAVGDSLLVAGADAVTLLITAATDYNRDLLDLDPTKDPQATSARILDAATAHRFDALRARHVADHAPRMGRVQLHLAGLRGAALPTDARLQRVRAGAVDPHLTEIYFQYGRYLLLGSSRHPGVLPANLQGIWNEHIDAPWESDYHVNINLQMNYWPAEVTNIWETVAPLVALVDALRDPGRETAREMYGARGWAMHHNTDIFGRTGLHDGIHWGTFPLGGAWMTFPVWRHYLYNPDRAYLETRAYPILRETSEFVLDFLVEGPQGYLVTTPSYSPENAFILPGSGEEMQLTYAPTMDVQIIQELFRSTISAAETLGTDASFREALQEALERLPPARVGTDGTIVEWIEDYEEAEPGHRHISHLLALHPGSSITPETPELFAAARATIDRRLAHGGGHTGWSRAWIINFFARLRDGERAHEHLQELYRRSTHPNLFDDHPPFQIDGNFGGTAGIAEMLLQSHAGYIDLLPALPAEWAEGNVSGLRAVGGHQIDISWEGGLLRAAHVRTNGDGTIRVRGQVPLAVKPESGAAPEVRLDRDELVVTVRPGMVYIFRPAE